MIANEDIIDQLLKQERGLSSVEGENRYEKIHLKFNPFPKSGTANTAAGFVQISKMVPVDDEVRKQVGRYVLDALYASGPSNDDKFISAVVLGDYGSGKTQLLMYVKYLLQSASNSKINYRNPFVIYIDNPGVKLSELIGAILSKIGEENFRKFIWNKIIFTLKDSEKLKFDLKKFKPAAALFGDDTDIFSEKNTASYRAFIEHWISVLPTMSLRKEFKSVFREVIISILNQYFADIVVAEYFFEIVAADFGVNEFWERFTSGVSKQLENKYVEIINAIVSLVKDQGYTDFFMLIDEFEDLTQGRLNRGQIDNYLYNLRTLIDNQRQWCLMFSMTGVAYDKLRRASPPLADRIAARVVNIPSLDKGNARQIVDNYLLLASADEQVPNLFTDSAVAQILNFSEYITRNFLRHCFELVEKLASSSSHFVIDEEFVSNNIL